MTKFRKVTIDIDINAGKGQVWDLLYNRFGEGNNFYPLITGMMAKNAEENVGRL